MNDDGGLFLIILFLIFIWPDDNKAWRKAQEEKLKLIDRKLDRLLGYWDDGK